jgi:hypothetical protein
MGRIRSRLTYANVISTLALFLVLGGGTALASYVITSNDEVGPGTISGHNPPSGDHANVITESLDTADLAPGSVTVGRLANGSVSTPKFAPGATAPDASQLGGTPASAYQGRITKKCGSTGRAITSVNAAGDGTCSSRVVLPIAADPTSTQQTASDLRPSDLGLIETCDVGSATIKFLNNGSATGTLNWMFSQGGTSSTVNATGNAIDPFPASINFNYGNTGRMEGQWIFSGGGAVTTVNLHAFQSGGSCEVRGTAEWAAVG